MNLHTLSLNCLACHILAKHPQFTKKNTSISIKTIPTISSVNQSKISENRKPNHSTEATVNHQLIKIA